MILSVLSVLIGTKAFSLMRSCTTWNSPNQRPDLPTRDPPEANPRDSNNQSLKKKRNREINSM